MAKPNRSRRKRLLRRTLAHPTSGCVMLGIPTQQRPTCPDEMDEQPPAQDANLATMMTTIPSRVIPFVHSQHSQWPQGITVGPILLDSPPSYILPPYDPRLAFPHPFPPISSPGLGLQMIYRSPEGSVWYPRINCGWFQVTLFYQDLVPLSGRAWVHLWPTSEEPTAEECIFPSFDDLSLDSKTARVLHFGRFYSYTPP